MKPVKQTTNDNCLQACVASLLEVDLETVPDFNAKSWFQRLRRWLRRTRRLDLTFIGAEWTPTGYAIALVETPEGSHAVVALDGDVVHDPAPRPLYLENKLLIGWMFVTPIRGN